MSAHPFKLAPVALASALAIGALAPNAVFAQSTSASASVEASYSFNVPSQSLGNALNELARQADLQLLVRRELVAGKQAPAVAGNLTSRQALDRLLAGSGLEASVDGYVGGGASGSSARCQIRGRAAHGQRDRGIGPRRGSLRGP